MEQKILEYLANIATNVENLTNDMQLLKSDINVLKADMKMLKSDVNADMQEMKCDVKEVKDLVQLSHRAVLETHDDVKILMERKNSNMDEELLRRNHAADITLLSFSNRLEAIENKLNN